MNLFGRRRRVPVLLQSTAIECGAACLAMILCHHGRHTGVAELRERMTLARDGATAAGLAATARELGLDVRGFKAEPTALPKLRKPLIAHWGMNHFVVVESVSRKGVRIVDPGAGRRRLSHEEVDELFTGIVLELGPTASFESRPNPGLGLWSFVRPFIPRSPGTLAAIVTASLLLSLLGLLPAFVTGYVVDEVLPSRQGAVLALIGAGIAGYALGQAVTALARAELLLWLQMRIDWSMMSSFLRHLMSLPYKFFQIRTAGDLIVRVSSTAYVRDVISSQMLAIVFDVALLGVYLIAIGWQSPLFVAVIGMIALVQLAVMAGSAPRAQRLTERELQAMGDAQSTLLEMVTSAETVKAAGAEDVAVRRWSDRFTDQLSASLRRRRLDNGVDAVLGMSTVLSPMVMLWLGALLVLRGTLSLGTMFALIALAGAALGPVSQLGRSIKVLQVVRVHLDRLRDVFDEEPEDIDQGDCRAALDGGIALKDVAFRYSGAGPDVLEDVSIEVAPHEKLAIVGHSGSGKSTLSRLILGLYPPTRGAVSYGGTLIGELDLGALRRQCGVVTQKGDLFSGSILTNIALVAPDATMPDIVAAAKIAEIHDEIIRMPMGYETMLGEGGSGLSGGQRQRIALARAIVARPRVLLLDEATNHLDARTEARVHRNLSSLRCTRIIIAHRLSTVRDADRILVLDEGRVVETGTHDRLMSLGGMYAELVGEQLVT